ncbi:MAG TPA: hypothetical protein VLX59_08085 [Acidimicrobiales bacterium]|nr:hypothetical protein [Acidimicrobiales bacterium]
MAESRRSGWAGVRPRITGDYVGSAWDRQSIYGETAKAYDGFVSYRDLGPRRSIANAGRVLGKSQTVLERWSVLFAWVTRAALWDDNLEAERTAELIQQAKEMARRQAQMGVLMQAKGLEKLQSMSDDQVADLSVAESVRLIEAGAKLEREARGLPSQIVAQEGRVTEPLERPGTLAREILARPKAMDAALDLLDALQKPAELTAVPDVGVAGLGGDRRWS